MSEPRALSSAFQQLSYEELAEEVADVVLSHELTPKDELVGVPHVITGLSFRPSEYGDTEYVSVEATAKDKGAVVYNDGSTGIRRQVMQYLMAKDLIRPKATVKDSAPDDIADLSITRFDIPNYNNSGKVRKSQDEEGQETITFPVLLHVSHGLRRSDFKWTDPADGKQKPATTFYLS